MTGSAVTKRLLFVAPVLVGAGLLWLLLSRSEDSATVGDRGARAPLTGGSRPSASADPPRLVDEREIGHREGALHMTQAKEDYLEFARFPPWSRPATPAWRDLYEFNRYPPDPHRQGIGRTPDHQALYASGSVDRVFVAEGHPAQLAGELWIGTVRDPFPFRAWAEVRIYDETQTKPDRRGQIGFKTVATIPLTDDPADQRRKLGLFEPWKIRELGESHQDTSIVVWIQPMPPGGSQMPPYPFDINIHYAASTPFRIIGHTGDRVRDGGLEVSFEVDVTDKVPVEIRAALFDATGRTPIAIYDDWFRPTRTGRQQASIRFFGKAINEAKVDGPYVVGALHGVSYYADEPVPELFWQELRTFKTDTYRASDFSDAEWSDPEKDAKVEAYDQAQSELERPR